MNHFTFEYPIVFVILLLFYICSRWCKAKGVSIYFPNMQMLKIASKKSSLLSNTLKLFTIVALVIALSSPIKQDEVVTKMIKGMRYL